MYVVLIFIFIFVSNIKCHEHDIITLNLQGTKFQTTRQTLYQIPYFKDLSYIMDNSSTFYMDRSPHIFKHILAWAVDKKYPFPHKYVYELDFYKIHRIYVNY